MTSAADMVLAARRLPAGCRAVLTLAHRPGSPVVHVYLGPVTPSGRFAGAGGRTVCHQHTRRLTVLDRDLTLLDHGRTVCARCRTRLASLAAGLGRLVSRDDHLAAFRGSTLRDLVLALALCRSVDETHRVSFIGQLLFGPPPVRRPVEVSPQQAWHDLSVAIVATRHALAKAGRTPEELEAIRQQREADEFNAKVLEAGRRQTARIDKLTRRATAGQYLTGKERDEIGMTG